MNIQSNSKNVDTDGTNAAEPERKEPAEKEETADEADFVSGVSEVSEEEPRQEGKIKKKKKRGSEAMAWIRDIVAAVLIAVIIAQFIQPTIVREHSMQNTLQPNDYLILSKMAYKFGGDVEYGDIVVFKSDVEQENGKKGAFYHARTAFCFETQNFPDAVNKPHFPSPIIEAGREWKSVTGYRFYIHEA